MLKFVTWNVNSLKARLDFVLDWIGSNSPDIVCLQETKLADFDFPRQVFDALGYESFHVGQGRWNGVAVISKGPILEQGSDFQDIVFNDVYEARHVRCTTLGLRVHCVYVPNGRDLADPHYLYKLQWLDQLRKVLEEERTPFPYTVVAGDFNVAPSDMDVYDPEELVGMTHVSHSERDALRSIEALGFSDAYRALNPNSREFSWWDYRQGAFHKGEGLRIDLAYCSSELARRVERAYIDRNARKVNSAGKPSDHAPVVLELAEPV